MTADFDFTIIGGGVIGLACARALAKLGSVLLIEQHALFGSETSSRNSEVIHAGLYYPSGSLKESLCIRGRERLYQYCASEDIPYQRIGKLIVAPTLDHPKLTQLEAKAQALNIPITRLNATELRKLEPKVKAAEALFSPETGIIDSHTYMLRLSQDAERLGALLMKNTSFNHATATESMWQVSLMTAEGPYSISTGALINAAGLYSHNVARACGTSISELPALHYCRGHYFSVPGKTPFQHLIYPLPEDNLAGLGIHATLDLGGQVRFGPDTQYLETNISINDPQNYQVAPELKTKFAEAIRSYYPDIDLCKLQPGYAGIRPKLSQVGEPTADFTFIRSDSASGAKLLHMLGIESPGLTASLAIADEVAERLII